MRALLKAEIEKHLAEELKNWKLDENTIKREFKFKTFVEAFSFMTAIALEAEKLDHHPDWSNAYNKVSIALATHSSNGITQLDFDLAHKIDNAFKNYE